jgi:glycolate oxidase iron-sulfur subunit
VVTSAPGPLGLDPDDLATCVGCGLCLPHCPTYRVTGEESASPRGRIASMRAIEEGRAGVDDAFAGFMDACVQCRGCETACPSDVPFGRLMADTRVALVASRPETVPRWMRLAVRGLGHPRLLRAGSRALAVAQRAHLVPSARLGLPNRLPLRSAPLRSSGADVWLFTGCVMDAWLRSVHEATKAVIEATGVGVALPDGRAACCGALHEHAGLERDAARLAARTMAAFPGDAPVLVDSAGCGAMLKSYGARLGTVEAERFSARVLDVHEWLAARLDRLPAPTVPISEPVAIQDPCHLRHVQRVHAAVHAVLAPFVTDLRVLDDEGLCCGAGGAYSALHPETSAAVRERKLASIERSGATTVASANPGCALHLSAGGAHVVHPMELVARALGRDMGG